MTAAGVERWWRSRRRCEWWRVAGRRCRAGRWINAGGGGSAPRSRLGFEGCGDFSSSTVEEVWERGAVGRRVAGEARGGGACVRKKCGGRNLVTGGGRAQARKKRGRKKH
jgi:hypothetical protein